MVLPFPFPTPFSFPTVSRDPIPNSCVFASFPTDLIHSSCVFASFPTDPIHSQLLCVCFIPNCVAHVTRFPFPSVPRTATKFLPKKLPAWVKAHSQPRLHILWDTLNLINKCVHSSVHNVVLFLTCIC
jgi:hypothetical protein